MPALKIGTDNPHQFVTWYQKKKKQINFHVTKMLQLSME